PLKPHAKGNPDELLDRDPRHRRGLRPARRPQPARRAVRASGRLSQSPERRGRVRRRRRPRGPGDCHRAEPVRQRLAGAGRSFRRHQGAACRRDHHRRARSLKRAGMGSAFPDATGSQTRVAGKPGSAAGMTEAARRAIERTARESYGRLLAFVAARSRDIIAAEDALADAFHAALETWPRDGVPDKPEAWLLTAARRRLIDAARRAQVRHAASDELQHALELAQQGADEPEMFPDERLKLLFACAHPAIDAAARTPLML